MPAPTTPPELSPRLFRLVLFAAVLVLLAVLAWPLVDRLLVSLTAEPRAVTARGAGLQSTRGATIHGALTMDETEELQRWSRAGPTS
jgi:hypothetical protein